MWMPPGPQQYTLPAESSFMPSGAPGLSPFVSAHTRPLVSVPDGITSKTRMCLRAREQPPLAIVRQAIRHVGGLAERGDAVLGGPAAHVVAGHVAPQQELAGRMPERALGEEKTGAELLERRRHFLPGFPATYQS